MAKRDKKTNDGIVHLPGRDSSAREMLDAVAAYLNANGWRVVVIGSPRVQKQPTDYEFNYEFVLRFTGKPPKEDAVWRAEVVRVGADG